ncbi:MAG: hypothetical protein WBZ36_23790 [Candidatus Nitrosopolaris sp.]
MASITCLTQFIPRVILAGVCSLIGALGITQETCGNELLFKSVITSVLFTKCGAYGSVYVVPLAEKGFQYSKARPVDIAS